MDKIRVSWLWDIASDKVCLVVSLFLYRCYIVYGILQVSNQYRFASCKHTFFFIIYIFYTIIYRLFFPNTACECDCAAMWSVNHIAFVCFIAFSSVVSLHFHAVFFLTFCLIDRNKPNIHFKSDVLNRVANVGYNTLHVWYCNKWLIQLSICTKGFWKVFI